MNKVRIILSDNETLREMLLGVILSDVLIALIALIVSGKKGLALLGVLAGCALAVFYTIHMAITFEDALMYDEKTAVTQFRKNMLIRYIVICAAVSILCYFHLVEPIWCIVSIITIKTGAYFQPVIHKLLNRSQDTANKNEGSENGGEISV